MKTSLFRYGLGLLVSAFLVTSCATKFPEYHPRNEDISWGLGTGTFVLSADEAPIVIAIQRGVADKAVTVPLTIDDPNGIYTLSASSVDFAVGEFVKNVELTYSYAGLIPGKSYDFTLDFPADIAGPGCTYSFDGNGIMKLEYEDFLNGEYNYYRYFPGGTGKNETGPSIPDLVGTTVKLQKAKNTDNFYKLFAWGSEIEFEHLGAGNLAFKKYSGYNEGIYQITTANLNFYAYFGSDTYYFNSRIANTKVYDESLNTLPATQILIKSGYYFRLEGWVAKNGSWSWLDGEGYNMYQYIKFL